MSEENPQHSSADADDKRLSIPAGDENYEVVLNKSKEELTIREPSTGRVITIRARVEVPEEETAEVDVKPLSPDDFREALQKMDALGLSWTADGIPRVIPKEGTSDDVLLSEVFTQIQGVYPALPRELGTVVFHALTGMPAHESVVGSKDDLQRKVSTVHELLITPNYRSEYFFKHAIKVPYFEGIDWEVLLKTHERNVEGMPGMAYALLMLTFHNPNPRVGKIDEHQNMTVAVNVNLVDKLIGLLIDVRTALESAEKLIEKLNEPPIGESHAG